MKGRTEDAELLSQLDFSELDVDQCGGLIDYYFGPMLPDMGFITAFALHSYAPGFLLQIPGPGETELTPGKDDPLYARVFLESQNWSELIGCHNLEELNRAIDTGRIYDLVATAEALQEKKMAELADTICRQKPPIRLVCMAGPSSSGKTTFMKRLIVHLWVNGVRPVMLSLDDYFRNRDEMGNENWENLEALDLTLLKTPSPPCWKEEKSVCPGSISSPEKRMGRKAHPPGEGTAHPGGRSPCPESEAHLLRSRIPVHPGLPLRPDPAYHQRP